MHARCELRETTRLEHISILDARRTEINGWSTARTILKKSLNYRYANTITSDKNNFFLFEMTM